MSVSSLAQNLVQINHFFDCNYSSLMIQVLDRGVVITFKNKLIYGDVDNCLAKVEAGCYSLSIETTAEEFYERICKR